MKKRFDHIFKGKHVLPMYFSVMLLLCIGVVLRTNLTFFVVAIIFLLWDIAFLKSPNALAGRNQENILSEIRAMDTYMSYFIAIYGILFGILLALDESHQQSLFRLISSSGIPLWLLLTPFVLASVTMLFIPIQLVDESTNEISTSLRYLLFFEAYLEKLAIFGFVHIIMRLLVRLAAA